MRSARIHESWRDEDCFHFVTTNVKDHKQIFAEKEVAELLVEEFEFYEKHYNVTVVAYVIMPDHVHCIIWPENGEHSFMDFMRGVKGHFAKAYTDFMRRRGAGTPPISGALNVWQDSFFDYLITSERKLEEKINYIMENPVEDGLVAKPLDYPYLYIHPDYRLE